MKSEILNELVGKRVVCMTGQYFYEGTLIAFDDGGVRLDRAVMIFETGDMTVAIKSGRWTKAEPLNTTVYVAFAPHQVLNGIRMTEPSA